MCLYVVLSRFWSGNMNMEERIARINELARKSREAELSEAEKEEQAKLRQEYIASVRGNLRAQLDSMKIQRPDGTLEDVKPKK